MVIEDITRLVTRRIFNQTDAILGFRLQSNLMKKYNQLQTR